MGQPIGPPLSVILPVFNGAEFISEAVKSILGQTYTDFELLVIDDGCTDNTFEVLGQFHDDRIRVIRNAVNSGLVHSLNKGISQSTSDFIGRMDADDISEPNRFALQIGSLKKNRELGVISCGFRSFSDIAGGNREVILPESDREIRRDLFCKTNAFCHPATMMRRAALVDSGGYRQTWFPAEDRDLWLRILEKWRGANLPQILHQKYENAGSISAMNLVRQNELVLSSTVAALDRKRFPKGTNSDVLNESWTRGHLFVAFGLAFRGAKKNAEKHIKMAFHMDKTISREHFQELLHDRIDSSIYLGNADTYAAKRALNDIVGFQDVINCDLRSQIGEAEAYMHLVAAFRHRQLGNRLRAQNEAVKAIHKNAKHARNIGLLKLAIGWPVNNY